MKKIIAGLFIAGFATAVVQIGLYDSHGGMFTFFRGQMAPDISIP